MNRAGWILLGVFATFAMAWMGLVYMPYRQFHALEPQTNAQGVQQPAPYSPEAWRGRRVYIAEGCTYCHTQQLRGGNFNADLLRGWGTRRSIPRDYVHDYPQLLGTMRTGPDLSNVGARLADANWHYLHLYNSRITTPGSLMPPYRHLFELKPMGLQPDPDSLKLPEDYPLPTNMQIVTTQQARDLVAYLLSLDRTFPAESDPARATVSPATGPDKSTAPAQTPLLQKVN